MKKVWKGALAGFIYGTPRKIYAVCGPVNRPTAFGDWSWSILGGASGRERSEAEAKQTVEKLCNVKS